MPNGFTHLTINGISLIPIHNLLIEDKTGNNEHNKNIELITTGAAMVGTAKFPDKLEPALNPNHRAFYHSILFGMMVGGLGYLALQDLRETRNVRIAAGIKKITLRELIDIFWVGASASYLIHLLADGFTPTGLPLT